MQVLEALIFDVDGTLVDTEEAHRQAFNAAFVELDLGWNWEPQLYARLLGVSGGQERIAAYIGTLPLAETEKRRLRQLVSIIHSTKTRIYQELVASFRLPLRTGVARLIHEAREAGMRLAIASTTTPANADALLSAALAPESPRWFSVIASGDTVTHKKPEPDIYVSALQRLRLPAECCVAFEDSENGVRAARAAQLYTVATPTRWTAGQDFGAAQLVLESLGDPDRPLGIDSQRRIGAPMLGVAQIERLHGLAVRSDLRVA
ncbi:MAG: HAD-IA family hydrolase [Betaproteobacteria bacterium]|nr:HAD-IA family hydrolase [Betaproteobacteria bacterium]